MKTDYYTLDSLKPLQTGFIISVAYLKTCLDLAKFLNVPLLHIFTTEQKMVELKTKHQGFMCSTLSDNYSNID